MKFIVKLFIKNYRDINDPNVRANYGKLAGIVGIITNLLLCLLKILIGFLSASVSIMADGINNLSDAGTSIITLFGFKFSNRPADEDHPFGHQRLEYVTGLVISFVIMMVGILLGKSSIERIISASTITISVWTVIVLILSISIKTWQGLFYLKMGKTIQSDTLKVASTDSFNDMIATSVVIIGMVVYLFSEGRINIDGYLGLLVSTYIIISGIKFIKETINPLIGTTPSLELINKLTKKIKSYEGVLGIHDLIIHSYGPNRTFASVHVEVSSEVDVMISHDLIDNIERDINRLFKIDLVIHMDPINTKDEYALQLQSVIEEFVKQVDHTLTIHDFRIVRGVTHTNVLFDIVIPPRYSIPPKELKAIITMRIKEYDETLFPVIQIDQFYNQIIKEEKND